MDNHDRGDCDFLYGQGRLIMPTQKIAAILLVVLGVLAIGYGGFSYTKETHEANIGSLHLAVDERQHVNVPLWVGVGALVVGAILLLPRGN